LNAIVVPETRMARTEREVEATSLLQVIERAARDPSIDIDKMERLLQMQERIVSRQAQVAYADALARLQPRLPRIGERGEIKNNAGGVQSRYALWEDIVEKIVPVMAEEGFSLSFRISMPDKLICVTGVLTHKMGHREETTLPLPADTSGSKNAVQAVASSVSYGKRYTASALLNLRTGELDDDAQSMNPITDAQVTIIRGLLKEADANEAEFLKFWKLEALSEIRVFNFKVIVEMLEKRKKRVDPRGDVSGVDYALRDKHVSMITDILNSDKDENDIADMLRGYVDEFLQPFPELWITVGDKLAEDKIISKANLKKYLSLNLNGARNR
jgi:ERF superfamily